MNIGGTKCTNSKHYSAFYYAKLYRKGGAEKYK